MINKFIYKQKGFSLVEVMIAIAVVLIGVVGIYALVPRIISTVWNNKASFTASQLAREGIEIVRNIRDTNALEIRSGTAVWDEGLDSCPAPAGCEVEYLDSSEENPALPVYGNGGYEDGRYLALDSATGFYKYDASEPATRFKRKVIIALDGANKLNVKIEVFWSANDSYVLEEILYDWR